MTTLDDRLRSVFADAFETEPEAIDPSISTETSAEWDSMRSIVLASSVETEFEVTFTDDELVTLDSYDKIRRALVARGIPE